MTPPGEPTSPILAKKQIGRGACRGRGENSGGGGLLKKKKKKGTVKRVIRKKKSDNTQCRSLKTTKLDKGVRVVILYVVLIINIRVHSSNTYRVSTTAY